MWNARELNHHHSVNVPGQMLWRTLLLESPEILHGPHSFPLLPGPSLLLAPSTTVHGSRAEHCMCWEMGDWSSGTKAQGALASRYAPPVSGWAATRIPFSPLEGDQGYSRPMLPSGYEQKQDRHLQASLLGITQSFKLKGLTKINKYMRRQIAINNQQYRQSMWATKDNRHWKC